MKRILAYDGLRGWLLIIISCNHLFGEYVSKLTREPFGFVSAAEGFVFLSGFIAYLVYGRMAEKTSGRSSTVNSRIWHRCLVIYSFHITTLLFTYAMIWNFPVFKDAWLAFFNIENLYQDPISSALLAIVLLEHPAFYDILIMYLVPMLFLPFAIKYLKKGYFYWVAGASLMVWLIAQFVTQAIFTPVIFSIFPKITPQISYFDPLSWQWLFYMGVLLSYLVHDKKFSFQFSSPIKYSLLGITMTLALIKHMQPEWLISLSEAKNLTLLIGSNDSVPLLRQINVLLLAYCFMLTIKKLNVIYTAKLPVFLGQHALPVFAFHTVAIYWLLPILNPYTTTVWYGDVLSCALFIALLLIPAKLDEIYRKKLHAIQQRTSQNKSVH